MQVLPHRGAGVSSGRGCNICSLIADYHVRRVLNGFPISIIEQCLLSVLGVPEIGFILGLHSWSKQVHVQLVSLFAHTQTRLTDVKRHHE